MEFIDLQLLQRFFSKIEKINNCWNWKAGKDNYGYGRFKVKRKLLSAHRFSYELFVVLIPKGMTIDHLCRNRACVNPEHLEVVTMKENVLRGNGIASINSKKTHCYKGHKFTLMNTIIYNDNKRRCRVCKNEEARNYNRNKKKELI